MVKSIGIAFSVMSLLVGGGLPLPDPIQPIGSDGNPVPPLVDPGYQDVSPEVISLLPSASDLVKIADSVVVSPVSPELLDSVLKEIDDASRKGARSISMTMDRSSASSISDGFNAVPGWTASSSIDYSHGAFSATSVLNISF